MPLLKSKYTPSIPFKNGHINTILTSLIRKPPSLNYKRERISTPDDDFLDLDYSRNQNDKIAILCHGLEGNSSSNYILGIGNLLSAQGYDILAVNYRCCSGEMNHQLITYNAGFTEDIHLVVEEVAPHYKEIYLVGFSLGGNLILKYLGESKFKLSTKIKAVAAISALVDLEGASMELAKPKNIIYTKVFLSTLEKKVKEKHKLYPEEIEISNLKKVKNLIDFDNHFTSTINGFKDAKDYYDQANSLQYLNNIKIPSIIINALDDPFASKSCFPFEEAQYNKSLYLMTPKYGGHVGFYDFNQRYLWNEKEVLAFFEKN